MSAEEILQAYPDLARDDLHLHRIACCAYPRDMRVGNIVDDRFVLEAQTGEGASSVVFRAYDQTSGTHVALKALLGDCSEPERFDREAAMLTRIEHPRVVRYIAHGGGDDGRYLVMEWLEGEDLSQRLARGPLDLDGALLVVRGIAEGLAALHACDIVHRDIKPSNTFLVGRALGGVKLLDLGIAKSRDMTWTLTATGMLLGTPAYMAPEQARGERVDARADMFALGCVFFESLAGRSPFAASHPVAVLGRILTEDPPRLRDVGVRAPAAVEALVASLLTKDPRGRPASAVEILARLDRLDTRVSDIDAQSSPSTLTFGEKRIVSVVLTRPASDVENDADATADATIDQQIRAKATQHDARVEVLSNGCYLAVFASTTSPTDHAARAAAFALDLAAILDHEAIALVSGRGQIAGRFPVGEVIDCAVSLLSQTCSGVRLDDVSASLLEGRFEMAQDGDAWQLVRAHSRFAPRRTVAGQPSPCVGRERELSSIATALSTCVDEPVASVVLLTARPGTGKSRIVHEALETLEQRDDIGLLLAGGCDLMNAGAPYGVLAAAMYAAVHSDSSDEADPREWLARRVRSSGAEGDVDRMAELIAESCGFLKAHEVSPTLRTLRDNPRLLGDAIAEAWLAWLGAEATHGAVVIVLEDLHWGDLPTIKLVDKALRTLVDKPLFVLGTARPEVHEAFPGLWSERGIQELRIGTIAPRSAERLVKRLLGAHGGNEIARKIVERSGGHPFLIEELVRAVVADPSKLDQVPETVLGMLQARFFTQNELSRAALRGASIFGNTFWRQGVERLLGGVALDGTFEQLIQAELIESLPASKFAGHVEYAFRHALIRDAAYATLTNADRTAGHVLAGAWLEEAGEREPFILAEHFDRGGKGLRAAPWYHRAAEVALEGNDLRRAIELAHRAIERGLEGEMRAMCELNLGHATYAIGDMEGACRYANAAREKLKWGSDPWFAATHLIVAGLGQRGLNDEVLVELQRAVEAATSPPTDAQIMCLARGVTQIVWMPSDVAGTFFDHVQKLAAQTEPGTLAQAWIERNRAVLIPYRWYACDQAVRHLAQSCRAFERAGARQDAMMMKIQQCIVLAFNRPQDALVMVRDISVEIERSEWTYLRHFATFAHALALFFDEQDKAVFELLDPHLDQFRSSARLYSSKLFLKTLIAFDAQDFTAAYALSEELVSMDNLVDSIKLSIFGAHSRVLRALGRIDDAIVWGERATAYATPSLKDPFCEVGYVGLAEAYLAHGEDARAREIVERFWNIFLTLPLDHARYRRRVFRDVASLACKFGLPHAELART